MEVELFSHIRNYREGHGGRLFVHCDTMLLSRFAESVERPFSALYPEVHLNVVESDCETAVDALLNASTDFALLMTCVPNHSVLRYEILGLTELIYCTDPAQPLPGLLGGDTLPMPLRSRPLMLAPQGTTLRAEQERLMELIYEAPPRIVCQAEFALLQRLASGGGGDTILPLHMLPQAEHCHCYSLQPPQPYYLVLAHNPSKALSSMEKDLHRLIQSAFEGFFLQNEREAASSVTEN